MSEPSSVDLDWLQPKIHAILTAPGVDLSVISGKRVRKALVEQGCVTPELLKENKAGIDALIGHEFAVVCSASGVGEAVGEETMNPPEEPVQRESPVPSKRKPSEPQEVPRPKKKQKQKQNLDASQVELSDAELARQLSMDLNRNTRSRRGAAATSTPGPSKGKSRVKKISVKSAETVLDSDASEGEEEGVSTPKPKAKRAPNSAFNKEFILSPALAHVMGTDRMSRPQCVKQLWVYIKANSLQNPNNGREILCDEGGLKEVFGHKTDMFKMNKMLSEHLYPDDSQ